ncbi:hypothetical protein OKW43_006751 [Paraburkholderia sp. WC7.3g]
MLAFGASTTIRRQNIRWSRAATRHCAHVRIFQSQSDCARPVRHRIVSLVPITEHLQMSGRRWKIDSSALSHSAQKRPPAVGPSAVWGRVTCTVSRAKAQLVFSGLNGSNCQALFALIPSVTYLPADIRSAREAHTRLAESYRWYRSGKPARRLTPRSRHLSFRADLRSNHARPRIRRSLFSVTSSYPLTGQSVECRMSAIPDASPKERGRR